MTGRKSNSDPLFAEKPIPKSATGPKEAKAKEPDPPEPDSVEDDEDLMAMDAVEKLHTMSSEYRKVIGHVIGQLLLRSSVEPPKEIEKDVSSLAVPAAVTRALAFSLIELGQVLLENEPDSDPIIGLALVNAIRENLAGDFKIEVMNDIAAGVAGKPASLMRVETATVASPAADGKGASDGK